MSGEPLGPVWPRLDREPPVFHADELTAALRSELVGRNWVRELPLSASAACQNCPDGRMAHVVWVQSPKGGPATAILPCRTCGTQRVDPERLRRWGADLPALLADVFARAGGRPALEGLLDGRVWFLGRATWAGRSREAYFARNASRFTRPAMTDLLARHPKAVVLVPTAEAARAWAGVIPNPVVALPALVAGSPSHPVVDPAVITSLFADEPSRPRKKPAPQKRDPRAAAIALLVREMTQHLQAARDLALDTLRRAGIPQLLPRPTQKQLAQQTGLSRTRVHHAIADPHAHELRRLWERALHVYEVLEHPA